MLILILCHDWIDLTYFWHFEVMINFGTYFHIELLIKFQKQTINFPILILKNLQLIQPNLPIIKRNRNKIALPRKPQTLNFNIFIPTLKQYNIINIIPDNKLIITSRSSNKRENKIN